VNANDSNVVQARRRFSLALEASEHFVIRRGTSG
jgi:hypothetical protein